MSFLLRKYVAPPTVARFIRSDATGKFIVGPQGSGKSVGSVIDLFKRAFEQAPDKQGLRRTRWAIVRNTGKQLVDTTIKTWDDWIPQTVTMGGRNVQVGYWLGKNAQQRTFYFGKNPSGEYTVPHPSGDGTKVYAEFLFRALDKPAQERDLLSMEVTGFWFNEFVEIRYPIIIKAMGRKGRYPKKGDVPATWAGIIGDSNPGVVGTPHHRLVFDGIDQQTIDMIELDGGEVPTIESFSQPGGLDADAENIENLLGGRQYYYDYIAMSRANGEDQSLVERYVNAKWVAAPDGAAVFGAQFKRQVHVAGTVLQAQKRRVIVIGMDFGLLPAAVCMQMDAQERWAVLREFYTEKRQPRPLSTFMESFRPRLSEWFGADAEYMVIADPAGEARSATDGRSCYDLLRSMKFLTIPGKIGLEDRIGSVQSMLNRAPGSPSSVLISPACQWLISGLEGGYQFRRLQTNQERYSDEPDKNEYSHLIDAFQYPVSYFVSPQLKGAPAPRYPEPRPDSRLKRNQGMKKEWSLRTATR